jgi:hypothetical protein
MPVIDLVLPVFAGSAMEGETVGGGAGAVAGMGEVPDFGALGAGAGDGTCGLDAQDAEATMNTYANDAEYLMKYIVDPAVSQEDRGAVMNAYGEVNTRLSLLRQMDMPSDDPMGGM